MSAGAAAATWWLLAPPSAGELRADQIALLALLLSASGYAVVALAAWHHAQTSREEPA
jgi:arylsulfatase A-like enzyme